MMESASDRRHGTFSYLPDLSAAQVRGQVAHILGSGWIAAVEHASPRRAHDRYWSMWKLPSFGVTDPAAVLSEVAACRAAHPGDLVKILGYDPIRQTQGLAFVVNRT